MSKKPATTASTVRTVLQSVTVGRGGQVVSPSIGQPFEFTADEIEQIEKMNPGAVSTVVSLDVADPNAAAAVQSAAGQGSNEAL